MQTRPPQRHREDAAESAAERVQVALAIADRAAFEPLYLRYLDPIHRYCYRRLGTREAAVDATSLVFTKALASLPGFRGGSFRSWLFAIAHNVVVDSRRGDRPERPLEAALAVVDAGPSPEDATLAGDDDCAVHDLLARLPAGSRRVVELRLAGLSSPEIGSVLARSPGWVRVTQFRAVARLRSMLDAASGDGEVRRDRS